MILYNSERKSRGSVLTIRPSLPATLPLVKEARTWGIAAYLALLIERLSQAVQYRPRPVLNPAQIRRYEGVRRELSLEVPYYPAQGSSGYVLIPKDPYFQQTEAFLERL